MNKRAVCTMIDRDVLIECIIMAPGRQNVCFTDTLQDLCQILPGWVNNASVTQGNGIRFQIGAGLTFPVTNKWRGADSLCGNKLTG